MKTILLIDADIIIYRFAAEGETSVESPEAPGTWMVSANADVSVANAAAYINSMVTRFKADDYVLCVTDHTNFRKAVSPAYKANRKATRPPILLDHMKQWLHALPQVRFKRGLEADDVMGIMSTSPYSYPGAKKIIVSIDKDMEQIPGWLFNPSKDEAPREISKVEGDRKFFAQVLVGDQTDGYPGLKGCGPKTAALILEGLTDEQALWVAVAGAFAAKGHSEAETLEQARLARILRYEDFDFTTDQPKLWSPSNAE